MAQTQPRQNFTAESEAGINKQINLELYASYVYQSMVSWTKDFDSTETVKHDKNKHLFCCLSIDNT